MEHREVLKEAEGVDGVRKVEKVGGVNKAKVLLKHAEKTEDLIYKTAGKSI
jgi:hypothetical protein